ncbi:MAG: hypothetical protein QXD03_02130 [Candidatus Anstonellales archaeon]
MSFSDFLEVYVVMPISRKYRNINPYDICKEFIDNFSCDIDEVMISRACDYIMMNIFSKITLYGNGISLSIRFESGKIIMKLNIDKKKTFSSENLRKYFPSNITLYNIDRDSIYNMLKLSYIIDCKIVHSILYMNDYDNLNKNKSVIEIL